ncbi:hypothetical protein PCANC_04924 [Puccinia coronata f. sp. avenae]|uniref:Uncharacterized protein n=1 Tax=Puccinia coronata f. sp. avenae TaxID=200324 RepID=A0A2N5VWK2_9BASI|nr:hypothetical protein PCANC_04924 [Puccinia coronata f. sp. avenae]
MPTIPANLRSHGQKIGQNLKEDYAHCLKAQLEDGSMTPDQLVVDNHGHGGRNR